MAASFQAPPNDLKSLAPFLQRAHETKSADPALSYWCNYHAAQLGIPLLSLLETSSKAFLFQLMDTLEEQKKTLIDNDVVNGDDIVAKAYVENVALKVFAGADNEDRSGKASKATARRFLAAANFIEVLSNFGPLERDMEEKLKYSKWKAADIAKALREGRKPTPGAPGEAEAEEQDRANVEAMTGTQEAAARLAGLSATHPDKEQDYIDREMAKLAAADHMVETGPIDLTSTFSPSDEAVKEYSELTTGREESRISYEPNLPQSTLEEGEIPLQQSMRIGSPNFSRPLSIHSPSPNPFEPSASLSNGLSAASSPSPRPLPLPPGSTPRRDGLPIPPGGQGSVTPLIPPPHILRVPSSGSSTNNSFPSQPLIPTAPTYPSAPSPPSLSATTPLPSSLDPSATARVQKLAKWAVSALDYEDVETARIHLREALDICSGKPMAATTKR